MKTNNTYVTAAEFISAELGVSVDIEIMKMVLRERTIIACAIRAGGKTYREIGEILAVSTGRAQQMVTRAVKKVRHKLDELDRKAAEKAAEERAAAEMKERVEKVDPKERNTWEGLTIYDLDPSVRLFNVMVKFFEHHHCIRSANEIMVADILDALEEDPLCIRKTRNLGDGTWKELLLSLDRVLKNTTSSLYEKYKDVKIY